MDFGGKERPHMKSTFQIWLRDDEGERRTHYDHTWPTYDLALGEIYRRDAPKNGEYFIKEVVPHAKNPLGLKTRVSKPFARKSAESFGLAPNWPLRTKNQRQIPQGNVKCQGGAARFRPSTFYVRADGR